MECLNCKKDLKHTPGKRKKQFCNPNCRVTYWQKNKPKKESAIDPLSDLIEVRKEQDAFCIKRGWNVSDLLEKIESLEAKNIAHGFHDITCSANPAKPMGSEGCSCAMYRRAKAAEELLKKTQLVNGELYSKNLRLTDENKPKTPLKDKKAIDVPEKEDNGVKGVENGSVEAMPDGLSAIQQAVWRNNLKMKNKPTPITGFGLTKKEKK